MKKFHKNSIATIIVSLVLSLVGPFTLFASTMPPLGTSGTFGILSSTFTRNTFVSAITGDLGYTTLSGSGSHTVTGVTSVANATYSQAGTDQGVALTNLNNQYLSACTLLGSG